MQLKVKVTLRYYAVGPGLDLEHTTANHGGSHQAQVNLVEEYKDATTCQCRCKGAVRNRAMAKRQFDEILDK